MTDRESLFASRLASALEQAVASAQIVWSSGDGRVLIGDFSNSEIIGYQIGAKEWEALVTVCRETGAADV